MAVPRYFRPKCGHDGCVEYGLYQASDRTDSARLERQLGNGKWRCSRHSQPDEVLSPNNTHRTYECVSRQEAYGRFFGNAGFVFGPGFKLWAKDFPAGTTLRVTAEVILPPTT